MKRKSIEQIDSVPILRSGNLVAGFLGSFGNDLKETRITAALGYLLGQKPALFQTLFGVSGEVKSVTVEAYHATKRADIQVQTKNGCGIIEAKVDGSDPTEQALKNYRGKWHILITNQIPFKKSKQSKIRYFAWADIARSLKALTKEKNPTLKFLSIEMLSYLEEHHMIKKAKSGEIYTREINDTLTMELFLKAGIYCCEHKKSSSIYGASYFAPHFGKRVSEMVAGVKPGISYISRIINQDLLESPYSTVETWLDFWQLIEQARGKAWIKKHQDYIKPLKQSWKWTKGKKRTALFLENPRLVFNPPIREILESCGFEKRSIAA